MVFDASNGAVLDPLATRPRLSAALNLIPGSDLLLLTMQSFSIILLIGSHEALLEPQDAHIVIIGILVECIRVEL